MRELTINEATCFFGGKPIANCDCAACMLACRSKERTHPRNSRSGEDRMYDDDDDAEEELEDTDDDDAVGESGTDGLVRDFIRLAVDILKSAALDNPIMRARATANQYGNDFDEDYPIPQTINWEAERAAERAEVHNRQSVGNPPTDSSWAIRLSPAAQAMLELDD